MKRIATKMRLAKSLAKFGFLAMSLGISGCSVWKSWEIGPETKSKKQWVDQSPKVLDTKPDTRRAQIELAMAAAQQFEARQDYQAALHRYQEVLVLDKKNVQAHHRMALVATRMSAMQQAQEHFQTALSLAPKDEALIADFAYWHYLHGNHIESLELLNRGLSSSPGYARYHGIRGLVLTRQGQYEEAVSSFVASGCNPQEAWANVGHVLLLDGDIESAQYWIGHAAQGQGGSEVARKTQRVIQASFRVNEP